MPSRPSSSARVRSRSSSSGRSRASSMQSPRKQTRPVVRSSSRSSSTRSTAVAEAPRRGPPPPSRELARRRSDQPSGGRKVGFRFLMRRETYWDWWLERFSAEPSARRWRARSGLATERLFPCASESLQERACRYQSAAGSSSDAGGPPTADPGSGGFTTRPLLDEHRRASVTARAPMPHPYLPP